MTGKRKLYIGLLVLGLVMVGGGLWFLFNPIAWRGKPVAPPTYTGPTISDELQSGWKKTTIAEMEIILGVKLPVPSYLPSGYAIKEVYYHQQPNSTQVSDIRLMISDQPVRWESNRYTCRLVLEIGWHELGLGLKMPWAQYIPDVRGRLEDKDGEYVLWWEYGTDEFPSSTLRLYSSNQFSKDELVKIAVSMLP